MSLTIGAFAIGMTEFVIMGLLPNVASDLNVSIPKAGQLITGYALGVAVGGPIMAIITNRLPKKMLLCLLMLLFILGNIIAAVAPSYSVLMVSRILTALTHGTFYGVGSIIASGLVRHDKRASAISLMMAGITVANIIGVPFGTFIGQHFGWRASFTSIAILGVLSLICIITFIPKIRNEASSTLIRQLKALAQPKLVLIYLAGAFGVSSLFIVFTYIAPLLEEVTGFAEHSVSWILVLFGCGVTLGNLLGGKLADWKLMPWLIVSFTLMAAVLALFWFTDRNPTAAVITIFIWGMVTFGLFPGLQLRIMTLAKDAPALASTTNHAVLNLGNAGAASLGGLVITQFGLSTLPLFGSLLSFIGLLLIVIVYVWDRRDAF
ncbi:MFS transporter [Paenibacillus durus]|nr:MFS transporter [Paenibacillus durus]